MIVTQAVYLHPPSSCYSCEHFASSQAERDEGMKFLTIMKVKTSRSHLLDVNGDGDGVTKRFQCKMFEDK